MRLFDFAFCNNFNRNINNLAGLCPEKWSFGSSTDNLILKNYINHTFDKLYDESSIIETDNYALFNTGLYTTFYQEIYAYFTKNRIPNKQKWFLDGFYTAYQLTSMGITHYPSRANYFSNTADLVFDTTCDIMPQYDHIFNDSENLMRIPDNIRNSTVKIILFDGAVKHAKQMINANYKTAVPQYYKGKIQLLIPIRFVDANTPDLALVVNKNEAGNIYIGHTCLTLDMAYNNARLIARPDSIWLKP